MTFKKKIVFCGLLPAIIFLGMMSQVSADVLLPGQKGVGFSYEISNMNDYDEYVFLLYGLLCEPRLVTPGEPIRFYKFASPSIYAVNKDIFNESDIGTNQTEWQYYFGENPDVIHSNIVLESIYTTVPEDSPLESSQVILRIVSLDDYQLVLEKSSIIFTYTDGSTEEQSFMTQDEIPSPSRSTMSFSWFSSLWFIVLPCTAVAGILYVLVKRRQKQ